MGLLIRTSFASLTRNGSKYGISLHGIAYSMNLFRNFDEPTEILDVSKTKTFHIKRIDHQCAGTYKKNLIYNLYLDPIIYIHNHVLFTTII